MSKSQRRFPREEIQIEVELSFLDDIVRTVITRDMSQGGLFLILNNVEHYPMGEVVNMRFKDPSNDFEETTKDGIVVRQTDQGIAVAYVEMEEF